MGENSPTPGISPEIDNFKYFLTKKPLTRNQFNFTYLKSQSALKHIHSNVEWQQFSRVSHLRIRINGQGNEEERKGRAREKGREGIGNGERESRQPTSFAKSCIGHLQCMPRPI